LSLCASGYAGHARLWPATFGPGARAGTVGVLKDRRKLGGVDIFSYGEADREVLEDGTIEKQGETIASAAVEGAVGLSDDGSSS
jgi:hypothetical protein